MKDLSSLNIVMAAKGPDGEAHFIEPPAPFRFELPGVVESVSIWETRATPHMPDQIGAPPADMTPALPGATKFGLVCFAARSAGRSTPSQLNAMGFETADDGMRGHDTLDYQIVLSGKIDIVLRSGEARTLTPGSVMVMGGVDHAWRNPYDEPCVFATVSVGATGTARG